MTCRRSPLPLVLAVSIWLAAGSIAAAAPATPRPAGNSAASAAESFDDLLGRIIGSKQPRIGESEVPAALQQLRKLIPPSDEARKLRAESIACNDHAWYDQPSDQLSRTLDDLHQRAVAMHDKPAEFHVFKCRAQLLGFLDQNEQALHAADRAIVLAGELDDPALQAIAHFHRGGLYSLNLQQAAALIDLEKADELIKAAGWREIPFDFQLETMVAYRRMGMHDKAVSLANHFRAQARGQNGGYRRIIHGVQVAYAYSDAGMPEDAWRELESIASPYSSELAAYDRTYLFAARSHVLVALKRYDDATREVLEFERAGFADSYPIDHALLLTTRGKAYTAQGRKMLALDDYNHAEQLLASNANPRYLWPIYIGRAHVRAALGQSEAALKDYARGAELQMQLQKNMGTEQESLREMQRQVDAREQENASLRREKSARSAELQALKRARRWQITAIVAASLTIVLLALLSIQQFRRSRILRRRAETDSLTGAASRASVMDHGKRIIARDHKASQPTALIAFDIDHFKAINDQYGHPRGDEVLRAVVGSAKQHLRGSDVIGRIGGEEFLIACANTSPGHAAQIAERIRASLHDLHWPEVPALEVTASFGIAKVSHDESSPEPAIERADQALYRAKHSGRDRVEVQQG
ncbi:MAG: GGDEF domain-containing protein [Pseudomonadota bacterium]|nr:GGDEF domain-containing protein [Pseudomonadota bacterium]